MHSNAKLSTRYNTPFRQAQRDLTRSRIRNAARDLFHEKHYDTTTMDEIAMAAGLRRSTLYLHYKDKAEILRDVIDDYTPSAIAVLSTLKGPEPSLDDLYKWIKRVAKFIARERVPLSIIREARDRDRGTAEFQSLINQLLAGIGTRCPKFMEASQADADPAVRARGLILLEELTFVCNVFLENTSDERGKAMLRMAAEDFHAFIAGPDRRG